MFYTGVGSRKTPLNILDYMSKVATWLEQQGYILRTGDASGADEAFRDGCTNKYVYRPKDSTEKAKEIAARYHPAWHKCEAFSKLLHARNAFQVLGTDLNDPSDFLICWTQDGCEQHSTRSIKTGGTGTAISIASEYGIPVFNLSNGLGVLHKHLITIFCLGSEQAQPIKLQRACLHKTTDGLDITVKSASGLGRSFAPTWQMVMDLKNGKLDEVEYERQYLNILEAVGAEDIRELYTQYKGGVLTFLCYCHEGIFCHTHLLIKWLTSRFPKLFY